MSLGFGFGSIFSEEQEERIREIAREEIESELHKWLTLEIRHEGNYEVNVYDLEVTVKYKGNVVTSYNRRYTFDEWDIRHV